MTSLAPIGSSDEGISSLIGFIAAMAILSASMGLAVYFIMTTPEKGTSPESRALDAAAGRAAETVAKTSGDPSDWDNQPLEDVRAVGLLDPDTKVASLTKIREIQNGNLTASRWLESLNLGAQGYTMDVTGQLIPVPSLRPPTTEAYIVANATSLSEDPPGEDRHIDVDLAPASRETIKLFEASSPGIDWQQNNWSMADETVHPKELAGNVMPDDPWFVESQLIPQMAGIEGVYTIMDQAAGDSRSEAAVEAMRAYHDGKTDFPRWRVFTDGIPWDLPGTRDPSLGDHALVVGYRKDTGSESAEGIGLWRSKDGPQSWALLGGIDTRGSVDTELTFQHLLRVDDGSEGDQVCTSEESTNCVEIHPSILYWNQTAGSWSRLQPSTDACPQHAWDDDGGAEASSSWTTKSVDLCQAERHSGAKLWLALGWETECIRQNGDPTECAGEQQKKRLWALDDMAVTIETNDGTEKTVWRTGFEPGKQAVRETLVTAQGVDHANYQRAPSGLQITQYEYLRRFVQARGNVLAYTPGTAGDWLGQVGLEAIPHAGTQAVTTRAPDSIAMRMPHELPLADDAYAAASMGWSLSSTPSNPAGGAPPTGFQPLTPIQSTNNDQLGTYLLGDPYTQSGRVVALGYDLPNLNKTSLRDNLLENAYVATLLEDPSFDMPGVTVPQAGTLPLRTSQRVMLAEATEDGAFTVPLEVTVYAWPTARGG